MISAGLFMLGFIAFPMPELFPRHYWLFHSLWHVLLAAGYYQLYALIETESLAAYKEARRHKHVRARRQAQAKETKQNLSVAEQHLILLSKAKSDVSSYSVATLCQCQCYYLLCQLTLSKHGQMDVYVLDTPASPSPP